MSTPIRAMATAIPIMAAGDVKVQLAIVLHPQSLDGRVNALGVGSTEELCKFSGPIHGLLLDLNCFGFVCRDHAIHSLHIAAWFDCEGVSRFDLASLGRVLRLTDLVGIDGSGGVDSRGVLSKFKNLF